MLKGCKNLDVIQDHAKLTNVKSKRRRNLVKKAIELSNMCNVETIVVVRDQKNKRITLYESNGKEFSIDDAKLLFDCIKIPDSDEALKWTKISYTNENYMNVKEDQTQADLPSSAAKSEEHQSMKFETESLLAKSPKPNKNLLSVESCSSTLKKRRAKQQFKSQASSAAPVSRTLNFSQEDRDEEEQDFYSSLSCNSNLKSTRSCQPPSSLDSN